MTGRRQFLTLGAAAMLVPLRPMMVTGVITQRPIMMRPELE